MTIDLLTLTISLNKLPLTDNSNFLLSFLEHLCSYFIRSSLLNLQQDREIFSQERPIFKVFTSISPSLLLNYFVIMCCKFM